MSPPGSEPESRYAWLRLAAALALMTLGGSGMYGIAVALAPVQAEFGVTRGDASLPYTLTMIGFGIGGILMGRIADRFGVVVPVMIGALGLLRMPDLYTRMHAASVIDTLGAALLLLGMMLQAGVTLVACIYVVINLIVDLTYGMLDPRIRIAR